MLLERCLKYCYVQCLNTEDPKGWQAVEECLQKTDLSANLKMPMTVIYPQSMLADSHRIGYLPDQAKTVLEEYWKFSKKIVAVQVQHF